MDKGDRGALVALGMMLAAVVAVSVLSSGNCIQPSSQIPLTRSNGIGDSLIDGVNQPVCSADDFNPWHDSYAQWFMAIISIVATSVSWWAVRLLRDTLVETRKATEAASRANALSERAFALDQRPWLQIRCEIDGPITFDRNGCNITLFCTVKNTGKTPALHARTEYRFYPGYGPSDPVREQLRFADEALIRYRYGFTVFPGDEISQRITTSFSNAVIDELIADSRQRYGIDVDFLSPQIVGTVTYHSPLTGEAHQTGFIYSVIRTTPIIVDGEKNVAIARSLGNVPQHHLRLISSIEPGRVT